MPHRAYRREGHPNLSLSFRPYIGCRAETYFGPISSSRETRAPVWLLPFGADYVHLRGIRRPKYWSRCLPGLRTEGVVDDLLHMDLYLGEPLWRSCVRRLRRWRRWPVLANLLLRRSLRGDLLADPAPSLRLDYRRWGRQRNPPVVFLLMVDVLPHRPRSRLVRNLLRLYCS